MHVGASQQRIQSAPASRAPPQQQQQGGQEVPAQVRYFAAHYAGDEGLARPFSAAPSDRNLAWGDTPAGLEQGHGQGPAHRHRHDMRHSPTRNASPMMVPEVCLLFACLPGAVLRVVPVKGVCSEGPCSCTGVETTLTANLQTCSCASIACGSEL